MSYRNRLTRSFFRRRSIAMWASPLQFVEPSLWGMVRRLVGGVLCRWALSGRRLLRLDCLRYDCENRRFGQLVVVSFLQLGVAEGLGSLIIFFSFFQGTIQLRLAKTFQRRQRIMWSRVVFVFFVKIFEELCCLLVETLCLHAPLTFS